MTAETIKSDAPTVYLVSEKPDTLDKPVFDFSNVSYRQGRESGRVQARISHLAKQIDAAGAGDDIDALLVQFDDLMDQQERHIFAAVAYIPQGWLVSGAPMASSINWQESDSIKWLRADKLQVLAKAKNAAQSAPN